MVKVIYEIFSLHIALFTENIFVVFLFFKALQFLYMNYVYVNENL